MPGTGPAVDPDKAHLFVILTNTSPVGENLLVPICRVPGRVNPKYELTCVLHAGDHPFLKAESFVSYYFLQTFAAVFLSARVEKKIFVPKEPIDAKILARICEGVEKSDLAPPRMQTFYREHKGVD